MEPTVEERMRPVGAAVGPALPLAILMHDYFASPHARSIPVVDEDRLLGEVSFDDAQAVAPADWPGRTVADVMSRRASMVTVDVSELVPRALALFASQGIEELLVVDGDRLVGIVHRNDLISR